MTSVIIQARLGSTRMPGKTMKEIMGKPLLYYSVKRSSLSKYIDDVIVATTTNSNDDKISEWCEGEGITFYRGSENNVLDRYYQTAKKFNVDKIVRITSDCPFVDPQIIDIAILLLNIYNKDYVSNRIKKRTWPHGFDVEVFTFKALEKAWNEANKPEEKEHVSPYILNHPEIFKQYEFPLDKDLSQIRLTVDYSEDFELADKLLNILIPKYGISFCWRDVISELENDPSLLEINKMRINTKIL